MVQHYCHGATIITHPIAVRTLFNLNFKLKTPSEPSERLTRNPLCGKALNDPGIVMSKL